MSLLKRLLEVLLTLLEEFLAEGGGKALARLLVAKAEEAKANADKAEVAEILQTITTGSNDSVERVVARLLREARYAGGSRSETNSGNRPGRGNHNGDVEPVVGDTANAAQMQETIDRILREAGGG